MYATVIATPMGDRDHHKLEGALSAGHIPPDTNHHYVTGAPRALLGTAVAVVISLALARFRFRIAASPSHVRNSDRHPHGRP